MNDKKLAYSAFVAAQKEFAPALKTANNPHFKSKYADLASCVEAVVDALNNHGLAVMQRPLLDNTGVTIQTVFLHETGEEIDGGTLHVPSAKNDPQGYGSAATYCRRYGLMAACGIAPEDDDGNAASKPQAPAKPKDISAALAAMDSAKTKEELTVAATAAWESTNGDERVTTHHKKCLAKLKADAEYKKQQAEQPA